MENQIKQKLYELEDLLLQPDIRRSPDKLAELLADEFIEFGSSGRRFTKQEIIDSLQNESQIQYSINTFTIKELATNLILATYHLTGNNELQPQTTYSLRSSIWKLIDKKWRMIFHQGTKSELDL